MSDGSHNPLSISIRIRVVAAALVIPPLLRSVSFARVASALGQGRPSIREPDREFDDAELARWTDRVLGRLPWIWRHTCLKRAAVLFYVLRCANRQVAIRIGVKRNEDGALAAHAWLVQNASRYLEPVPSVAASHAVIGTFPDS